VIHAAIAVRWPGHDDDGRQPRVKWYPLGATAEFRVTPGFDGCSWRILGGDGFRVSSAFRRTIARDIPHAMKHRVESVSEEKTRYRVKLWEASESEPEGWDLEAEKGADDTPSGGALLIAHYTDVTFGNVTVAPVW
jgi:hypothetical protein